MVLAFKLSLRSLPTPASRTLAPSPPFKPQKHPNPTKGQPPDDTPSHTVMTHCNTPSQITVHAIERRATPSNTVSRTAGKKIANRDIWMLNVRGKNYWKVSCIIFMWDPDATLNNVYNFIEIWIQVEFLSKQDTMDFIEKAKKLHDQRHIFINKGIATGKRTRLNCL